MNEWFMVRRKERAIYTHNRIQPFRSASEVPTQIVGTSGPSTKHCSWRSQRWSTQLELELRRNVGTSGSRNFRQSGLPTHNRARGLSPRALGLPAPGTPDSHRDIQQAKVRRRAGGKVSKRRDFRHQTSGLPTTKSPQTMSKCS